MRPFAVVRGGKGWTRIVEMTTEILGKMMLENGAVMTREEFHRAYSECEGLERVELIEGVVFMPSPISLTNHARPQKLMFAWLDAYEQLHPESVSAALPATVLLDDQNEPEPDLMLLRAGEDRLSEDGYLVGAPELVVEIANSSRSPDLHQKKEAYRRNGVLEYIVWRVGDEAIDWFQLRDGEYILRTPGDDGIIESEVFPGLRLDVVAMLSMNRKQVLAALGG